MRTDLPSRAVKIFGESDGDVRWPYGIETPSWRLKRTDPDKFEVRLPVQRAKQQTIVDWAERHGLKRSDAGCCPLWLQRNGSQQCMPTPRGDKCTRYGGGEKADGGWLDHGIAWIRGGKPAVLTSAPYHLGDEDRGRLAWWASRDPLLRYAFGDGWYGHGTTQVVLWRADRIDVVEPVRPGR